MLSFHLRTLGGIVHLSMEVVGCVGTIRVWGEVDAVSAPTLQDVADRMLRDGARDLVIDCRDIEFIDSTGLRAILHVCLRTQDGGGTATLRSPTEQTSRLLRITGLDRRAGGRWCARTRRRRLVSSRLSEGSP